MAANTRLATAIQILCVLAREGPEQTRSAIVSASLLTDYVIVLRMLKRLRAAGIVEMRQGKNGGVRLARPTDTITVHAVRAAVDDEPTVFALRTGGNPECPVNTSMNGLLAPIFTAVDRSVADTMSQVTIADLMRSIPAPNR